MEEVINNLSDADKALLLAQITREYSEGWNYVNVKRIQYRKRVERRNKQKKGTDKININMIANAIDTLIATSYTDGLTVNFAPKDGWIGQEKADNLNYMAEFDNNEDDYQQIYYQKEQDRYFFGVSVRYRYGWDDTRKIPLFMTINPLSWIPDPVPSQTGRFDGKNYRYHGFEFTTSIMDLMADPTYSREDLDKVVTNYFSAENRLNWTSYAAAYNYNMPNTCSGLKHNFALDVYHHFTSFNGKKYIITLANDRATFIRIKELKPVLREEKADPNLISYPIILNYWKPRRNDPFGESVCDKLDDKQIAKTILFNLNIIKAKKEALGGDMIWNSRLIKNKQDILKPTVQGRQIFVDTQEPLTNVGVEIPRSQIKTDTFNMMSAIDNEARGDVNIDSQQQGVLWARDVTATESQITQANSNIIGLLNNKINSRGDKMFRFERWKGYQENFSSADIKFAVINSNFEYKSLAITKDDFFTSQIPFIIIGTKGEIEWQNQKQIVFWDKYLALFLQDPWTQEASKLIAKRMLLRCNGKTPNEINVLCPLTNAERNAYDMINIVNLNIVPKSLFDWPEEYLWTYWIYLQKAEDTKAKEAVLWALQKALAKIPLPEPTQWPDQTAFDSMANSNQNIAASQAIQSSQRDTPPTRADQMQ